VSIAVWIGVATLGSLGALGRWLIENMVSSRLAVAFPIGTLVVNTTGSLALGLITGLTLSGNALVLAGAGAIGSYTTFSTWILETHHLGEDRRLQAAMLNIGVNLALGIGAVALGRALGHWM
jgi:fluoride exporter